MSFRDTAVVVEAFMASAPTEAVLEAPSALVWDFPDRAITVPYEVFDDKSFRDNFATFIEQSASQTLDRFAAKANKSGKTVVENRDVVNPALVNEMFISLLEGLGNCANVNPIRKHVRDEAILQRADKVWRRSPFWLMLRVTLRRHLAAMVTGPAGSDRAYYKFLLCVVLADVLEKSSGKLHPEKRMMLLSKFTRRLAKLEHERQKSSGPLHAVYDAFFNKYQDHFKQVTENAKHNIEIAWSSFRNKQKRFIPRIVKLPPQADLHHDFANSIDHLSSLIYSSSQPMTAQRKVLTLPVIKEGTISQVQDMALPYETLNAMEAEGSLVVATSDPTIRCINLAEWITKYLDSALGVYKNDSLLMSRCLLLLFERWVAMDKAATEVCPLLLHYHPFFNHHALDVLCLPSRDDMVKLRQIQQYLEARAKSAEHGTIFENDDTQDAFSHQFLHTSQGKEILEFGKWVEELNEAARTSKRIELQTKMDNYQDLSFKASQGVCTCKVTPEGARDIRGCHRCFCLRTRNRLSIRVHEDFLPPDSEVQKSAILFEIKIPVFLAQYRNATWQLRILGDPAYTSSPTDPALQLEDFAPLESVLKISGKLKGGPLTLASTRKSFHKTHYNEKRLPTSEDQVILPFGPIFEYYDSKNKVWASDLTSFPSFEHLLGSWVPDSLSNPFARVEDFSAVQVYKPSSYEIEASRNECPPTMSVHEFASFQRALTGRARRWPVLAVELGATNVNLSSHSTMLLFNHLAVQAGPRKLEKGDLREAHTIFEDVGFCRRLYEQINIRISSIERSWREVHCASILITFALRLWHIGPQKFRDSARRLLSKIRRTLSGWILHLRDEVRTTSDPETLERAAMYGFHASLLCRQTFTVLLTDTDEVARLTSDDLMHYYRASIAMQENLRVDLSRLQGHLKLLFERDLCNAYAMRQVQREIMLQDGFHTLQRAIDETWSGSRARNYGTWTLIETVGRGQSWWLATYAWSSGSQQTVHYHALYGHLLINNEPLGRLPHKMSEDAGIQELFGCRQLLTRPSSLHGMKYQLGSLVQGHEIHFGEQAGKVVIRSRTKDRILQFIPRGTFIGKEGPADLPSSLLDDNVHWLDLQTGSLDIRRKPNIWKEKKNNWKLDVRNKLVHRNFDPTKLFKTGSFLVRPDCEVAVNIARIFQGFEDTRRLTIYVANRRVFVEMKRLELTFVANNQGWLECRELGAEIGPDQDPGCLYGFDSGIVLRSISNRDNRSLMVAMGPVTHERSGMHVKVKATNDGQYVRFMINPILGRLDCPAEPIMLYTKALLHLLTSFSLPDPLTERTGVEEAIRCLSSAASQPWKPLSPGAVRLLQTIRALSPARSFYPDTRKVCQKVQWSPETTMAIQHDGLGALVDRILIQSRDLASFERSKDDPDLGLSLAQHQTEHLSLRGLVRRQRLERHCSELQSLIPDKTSLTLEFDPLSLNQSKDNAQFGSRVFSVTKALCGRDSGLHHFDLESFANLFWERKGVDFVLGFTDEPNVFDLASLLGLNIYQSMGHVLQSLRRGDPAAFYDVLFTMAILAFKETVDRRLMSWFMAFAMNPSVREIRPPSHSGYLNFDPSEKAPSDERLKTLIVQSLPDHSDMPAKKKQKVAVGKSCPSPDTDERDKAAMALAIQLVQSWPIVPKSSKDFQDLVIDDELEQIDMRAAWKAVEPEFQRLSQNTALAEYAEQVDQAMRMLFQAQQIGLERDAGKHAWFSFHQRPASLIRSRPEKGTTPPYRLPCLAGGLALKACDDDIPLSDVVIKQENEVEVIDLTNDREVEVIDVDADNVAKEVEVINLDADEIEIPKELARLSGIIDSFANSPDATRKRYGQDLQESLLALAKSKSQISPGHEEALTMSSIKAEISRAQLSLRGHLTTLRKILSSGEVGYGWLKCGNLWPALSPICLLELLREENAATISKDMKTALVSYGILITKLQRLLRLQDNQVSNTDMRHEGHENWSPEDHTEWLLLEIDNNILIRPTQIEVARAIIDPPTGSNSVLQMNMGQGKCPSHS